MKRCGVIVVFSIAILCSFTPRTRAQTSVNPDISIIPRFLFESNDGERLSEGVRKFSRPDMEFQELELAISSYLNPFAKADVVLTLPGPDVENSKLGLEEAYASVVRGLPLDMNIRIGKYRAEFGKLNATHPHAWPFISQPLSQKRFLGEDGLNDIGVSASVLFPTGDVYSKLTVDLLRGGAVGNGAGISDSTGARPYNAVTARLMGFFTLDDENDLEAGLSTYTGIHDPYNRDRFWYINGDMKYKWRPSAYTSLVVQGEYLLNVRKAWQDASYIPYLDAEGRRRHVDISSSGLYVYTDFQFFKMFSLGARFDWAESPYSSDDRARGGAAFVGYYPVEETLGLRFEYQRVITEKNSVNETVNTMALQVLFSLGPHKAHPF